MSMVIYVNGLRIVLNNQIAIWTQNVSRRHYSQNFDYMSSKTAFAILIHSRLSVYVHESSRLNINSKYPKIKKYLRVLSISNAVQNLAFRLRRIGLKRF